ncbi:MAG: hypothetical protein IJ157_06760, partial [Clostridia bacterium]|nr:hypothetical protein [Clostridia bacterium]
MKESCAKNFSWRWKLKTTIFVVSARMVLACRKERTGNTPSFPVRVTQYLNIDYKQQSEVVTRSGLRIAQQSRKRQGTTDGACSN